MKTPEQIRTQAENSLLNDSDAEYWLREIAAQLAELNINMRGIKDSLKSLDEQGIRTLLE